jgi:glycosyltransferase involved in cell wall biosynthesis
MKVSVVMPVYNAEGTVLRALESLRAQTIPKLEIVVINDGSTDGTMELLHQQTDIELLDHSHRGFAAALNDGLAAASGDYIARMDTDDLCHPNRMELQAAFLDVYSDIGLVGSRVGFGGDRKKQAGCAASVDWINTLLDPDAIALNRFIESPFAQSSVMFRRELFEMYGAHRDGPFPEDYELWLRWMANGVKMAKVDEELLTWNNPPGRLSGTDTRCNVDAFYRIKAEYLSMWLRKNNPHHPNVMVWGAARSTRWRAEILARHGIRVTHYIDLNPRSPDCGTPVIHHDALPDPSACFILPMIEKRSARDIMVQFLRQRGFLQGIHYISIA